MDDETHEAWRNGTLLELTATEFNLLRYMLENARRVLAKGDPRQRLVVRVKGIQT